MAAHYTADEELLVSFIGLPARADSSTPSSQLGLHDSCNLEEYEIITPIGIPLRVYVQSSNAKASIVTFHDIGTNHTSFLGFFASPEMRVICKHFTVYHVCAPGHHEGAINVTARPENQDESLLKSSQPGTGDRSSSLGNVFAVLGHQSAYQNVYEPVHSQSKPEAYPTLDELAEMLTSVVDYFKMGYFIGFGMGAGSNVLARYALHHPENVHALFLLNPNGTTHSYYEWFRNRWSDLPSLRRGVFTDNLLNQLENHWFGFGLAENEDLTGYYNQLLRSLNPVNVAGYIDSYINRTDLGLVRSLDLPTVVEQRELEAPPTGPPTAIKINSCLVTGALATDLSRALADLNGSMDPRKTQFLLIPDCTGFVMEEDPDKLAMNFLHFLRNEGMVITLTPEKLHKEAAALQAESALCANAEVPTSAIFTETES